MSNPLDPGNWPAGEYQRLLADQHLLRSEAGYAKGRNGAVAVAYGGLAARAGLEALKVGGNAIDAALTTAMMQVCITGGGPVSYFGIQSLVYYEAGTRQVHCMNAEWNTVLGEHDPMSIPGGIDMTSLQALRGTGPASGRTAMVGGFMKGVGAAHARFGKLPFPCLFQPSIHAAENGIPVTAGTAEMLALRTEDLARLPETRATLKKVDGSDYVEGDTLKQPALAKTLRAIAENGTDYMYKGPWAEKLVAAVQADGGKMTLEDLGRYDVVWAESLVGQVDGYEIHTSPAPNGGGLALIEAQLLARAAGLHERAHWTESGHTLRDMVTVAQMLFLNYLPEEARSQLYPGLEFTQKARLDPAHASELWKRMDAGALPFQFASPMHSDDVVVIDSEGNIAAITHSSNNVMWGRTGINIDGISISDSAAHQQPLIARVTPGDRLPAPTETGIVFKDGEPVLGFASMGAGLHHRTLQGLLNFTAYGKSLRESVDTADFFGCGVDPKTGEVTLHVPKGRFSPAVLRESGVRFVEIDSEGARFGSEGIWIGISRDPATGELQAVSHNRNNSAAFAY